MTIPQPDSERGGRLKVMDLFSGIGGFSLGLERTGGFETVAFCEIDPFCRRVLARHWPDVRQYEDVRTLTAEQLSADGIVPDVICGGFPCQDISLARGSERAGLDGARSGLWAEFSRLIGELRPRLVFVENVASLLGLGMGRVLGDLAAIGFDAEWHCIPAGAVGAPHIRDRLWVVGYADHKGKPVEPEHDEASGLPSVVADANGCNGHWRFGHVQMGWGSFSSQVARAGLTGRVEWSAEPDVGRVAHGIPSRVDRLRSLGNAVVPQIPELIGNAILAARAS